MADQLAEHVRDRHGRLDVLVDNAAIVRGGPLGSVTAHDLDHGADAGA